LFFIVFMMTIRTELFLLFFIALGFSLALTPVARVFGIRFGALDMPDSRKVHTKPIPRIGGLAIFFAFVLTCCIGRRLFPDVAYLYEFNFNTVMGHAGAVLILLCGLFDDFRRLNAWVKLVFQIVAATFAFLGGATISGWFASGYGVALDPLLSYLVTVFWFLLFINAVNLIDGLDGLASGVVFFACVAMAFSTYFQGQYLFSFYFVILAGALLGFLRYNFNPANVFLGDGGSYFLGYVVALLAIRSSSKSNVGILMMMPLLALGVPVFDAVLSPIRRFLSGRPMFQPDRGHIHHAFLRLGLSSRNVVLIIYGISLVLCLAGISLILLRGRGMVGFVLAALLFGMIFLVRKLGYIEYLALDKFYGWFQDVTDVAGFSRARRSFLSMQIEAGKSQTMDELWVHVGDALEMLKFDRAELHCKWGPARCWSANRYAQSGSALQPLCNGDAHFSDSFMVMEIPLVDAGSAVLGKLVLYKDVQKVQLKPYTIRRVEHLRRTILDSIVKLRDAEKCGGEK